MMVYIRNTGHIKNSKKNNIYIFWSRESKKRIFRFSGYFYEKTFGKSKIVIFLEIAISGNLDDIILPRWFLARDPLDLLETR